jgi:dipeptidyl aminopeptidase/acylaminoacyl peptidase
VELLRWRSGEREIEGVLFAPASEGNAPRPLVLHPHGGPRDHAGDDFDPLLHGEKDERCPPAQGLMMHRGLKDNGVETQMVLYPREPHVFVEPRHIVDRARRVAEWFRAHDAGADPPR